MQLHHTPEAYLFRDGLREVHAKASCRSGWMCLLWFRQASEEPPRLVNQDTISPIPLDECASWRTGYPCCSKQNANQKRFPQEIVPKGLTNVPCKYPLEPACELPVKLEKRDSAWGHFPHASHFARSLQSTSDRGVGVQGGGLRSRPGGSKSATWRGKRRGFTLRSLTSHSPQQRRSDIITPPHAKRKNAAAAVGEAAVRTAFHGTRADFVSGVPRSCGGAITCPCGSPGRPSW
jgi:hypothetical protein